jgi:DNA-binding CsgD family transcriptional regulator
VLSGTLWQLCEGGESEQAAREAMRLLEALPPGPALAEAYISAAASDWGAGARAAALDVLAKAQGLGERLGRADVVSSALSCRGMFSVDRDEDGTEMIERALAAALGAHLPQSAASAYINLQDTSISLQKLAAAQRYYAEGMAFCQERELWFYTRCLIGGQADTFLLLGRWDEAVELCERLLAIPGVSPANQLYPRRILASIHGRRGDADAWELTDKALALATGMGEQPWIAQAQAVRAELLWLSGKPELAVEQARTAYQQVAGRVDSWRSGSLAIWLSRLAGQAEFPAGLPEPYALEVAGDHAAAAQAWERLGRRYDAALAWLTSSDSGALKAALGTLGELGARPAAAAVRRRLKELGVTAIPRGPRASTRAAPAGLTAREQEVLALLSEGLPDREISQRLFISERTVHHHVSAVLSKIGVSSRTAAAREAAKLGIRA